MTDRDRRAAEKLAACQARIDALAVQVRAAIAAGHEDRAAACARRAAFEAGYGAWMAAKVAGRPFLAPMSARPPRARGADGAARR